MKQRQHGARLLKQRVIEPFYKIEPIQDRYDLTNWILEKNIDILKKRQGYVKKIIGPIYDVLKKHLDCIKEIAKFMFIFSGGSCVLRVFETQNANAAS